MVASGDDRIPTVILVTPDGPAGQGGIDRMMNELMGEARRRGLASPKIIVLSSRGEPRSLAPFMFILALARIFYAAVTRQVDLVHLNIASYGSTFRKGTIALLCSLLRVPYVVHLHCGYFDRFWSDRGRFGSYLIDRIFIRSAAIIVLGKVWKAIITTHLPGISRPIFVIPNATAASDCECRKMHPESRFQVLFLGRIGPEKGAPETIEALACLSEIDDWQATFAGNGDIETAKRLAQTHGLEQRITFPGWLKDSEVKLALQAADVLVLPSKAENLPMSIVEAFANGLPVIATSVGAIPEIVEDGRNGILVPIGDVPALTLAIQRIASDFEFRNFLGKNAKEKHKRDLNIHSYLDKMIEVWRSAIDSSRVEL